MLNFIAQAAKDCTIRAKDVVMNTSGAEIPVNPVFELSGSIIAMGMGHYRRVEDCPCNRYDELFFNGLLYFLYGVIGGTTVELLSIHTGSFQRFYFDTKDTGYQYTMDLLAIKSDSHDDIDYVQFGKNNANDSEMTNPEEPFGCDQVLIGILDQGCVIGQICTCTYYIYLCT